MVLISGKLGSGMSHTAFDILQALIETHEFHEALIINSPYDLNILESASNEVIVVADDCLGTAGQHAYHLRGWRRMAKLVDTLKENKQIYLIFTVENHILETATGDDTDIFLDSVLRDCSRVDLECNTFRSTTKERIGMHTIICKHHLEMETNFDDIAKRCEVFDDSFVGFPGVCSLSKIGQLDRLFANPLGRLSSYICDTREQRFSAYMLLALIVVLDDKFPKEGLGITEKSTFIKVQEMFKPSKCTYADMMDSVETLLSLNLISPDPTDSYLRCSHLLVYLAVLRDMATYSLYDTIELIPASALNIFRFKQINLDADKADILTKVYIKDMTIHIDSPTLDYSQIATKFNNILENRNTEDYRMVASSKVWTNADFIDEIQNKLGVQFYFKEDDLNNPLTTYLIKCGCADVLRNICQNLANIATNIQDKIALILEEAIKERDKEILGSFGHFYFGNGKTIVQSAIASDDMEIVQMVLNPNGRYRNFIQPVISTACATDNVEIVKYLFKQYGRDFISTFIRKKGPDDRTLIHYASKGGSVRMIEFLVTIGLDVKEQTSKGLTVLDIAVIHGRSTLVRYICSTHPDMIQITDDNGFTAAHFAAREGRFDILRYLLSKGADGKLKVHGGNTIVHLAAANGHFVILNLLMGIYPDLMSIQNDMSFTALQLAACFGQVEVIDLFRRRGTDLCVKTVDGRTLLHLAAFNGHLELVKYLCDRFPELWHVVDKDGNTVVHDAAASGKVEIMNYLLTLEDDPFLCNADGCTLLHEACYYGRTHIVKFLVSNFPRMISIRSQNGFSSCHAAALGGRLEIMEILINSRADPLALSVEGSTILHEAAFGGNLEMVKYISNRCPDMLMMDNDQFYKPIHFAAQEGHVDTLVYFVDIMDETPVTEEGQTLLHIAAYNGRMDVVKFLCGQFPDMINSEDSAGALATHYAARGGFTDVLDFLITKGIDPSATTFSCSTVIHLAAFDGMLDTVKYLCNKYPEMQKSVDDSGHNIAHYAAGSGNLYLLLFCIELGIDPMSRTSNGSTLLLKAAYGGKLNVVKFLANQYSDMLPIADEFGCNVLHYSVCGGHVDILQYLCTLNLDPMTKTNDGHTLLHIAAYHGQLPVVDFLCKEYPDLRYVTDVAGMTPDRYAQIGEQTDVFKYLKRHNRRSGVFELLNDRLSWCCGEDGCCQGPVSALSRLLNRCTGVLLFCRR